jgi:hypothetical protein
MGVFVVEGFVRHTAVCGFDKMQKYCIHIYVSEI